MMNRLPERGHIQETSLIKGIRRGRVITAEDQRIIRTQSRLEDLYPDYDSEGPVGRNSKIRYPWKTLAIGWKCGESLIFNEDMSVRESLPKFVKDTPSPSRQELIAQNREEIDRHNAEIVANEETANNENEPLEERERAREKVCHCSAQDSCLALPNWGGCCRQLFSLC